MASATMEGEGELRSVSDSQCLSVSVTVCRNALSRERPLRWQSQHWKNLNKTNKSVVSRALPPPSTSRSSHSPSTLRLSHLLIFSHPSHPLTSHHITSHPTPSSPPSPLPFLLSHDDGGLAAAASAFTSAAASSPVDSLIDPSVPVRVHPRGQLPALRWRRIRSIRLHPRLLLLLPQLSRCRPLHRLQSNSAASLCLHRCHPPRLLLPAVAVTASVDHSIHCR